MALQNIKVKKRIINWNWSEDIKQMAWFRFINDSLYSKAKQQKYVYSKFSLINIHSALFSVCRINITQ